MIPSDWSASGGIISVAVATYHEEKFLVADTLTGRKLLSMLQKRVIVEGYIIQGDGAKTIEVKSVCVDESPIREKSI